MRAWKDLTPVEQDEYVPGKVNLYGFEWFCYYKFVSDDTITMFTEMNAFQAESFTHYKSLVA